MHRHREGNGELGIALSELWLGIAIESGDGYVKVGCACNDGTYTVDFAVHQLNFQPHDASGCGQKVEWLSNEATQVSETASHDDAISDFLLKSIRDYQEKNHYKFLGIGIAQDVVKMSPQAPSRIWAQLDIVPIIIQDTTGPDERKGIDELADSVARKCLT